jgi:rhodanese-related sulfurtransferase
MGLTKFIVDNIVLILAAFVSGAMLIWPWVSRRSAGPAVSAFEATRLVNREKGVFLDVSEPHEYAQGHIGGSRHIPFGTLAKAGEAQAGGKIDGLPTNKQLPIIVVCATGARAGKAAALLRGQGYVNARALAGGLAGWRDAQMPVEKGA